MGGYRTKKARRIAKKGVATAVATPVKVAGRRGPQARPEATTLTHELDQPQRDDREEQEQQGAETEFLPLSQTILGRNSNHMAALGLSLHMRHHAHHHPLLANYI